jgi:hypothetical protein
MTPMLGILASSGLKTTSSYESIATVTVGSGGSSSISFSSIPSTYKHLQIRGISRISAAGNVWSNNMRFNSDSGSNYSLHYIYGSGSGTPSAGNSTSQTSLYAGGGSATGTTAPTGDFAAFICDILDYQNTNKYKTVRSLSGEDSNGAGYMYFDSGLWMNSTTAISSITISAATASFVEFSQFALYGIRG